MKYSTQQLQTMARRAQAADRQPKYHVLVQRVAQRTGLKPTTVVGMINRMAAR